MIPYSKDRPLISLHIPKTAGMALDLVFCEWFGTPPVRWKIRPRLNRYVPNAVKVSLQTLKGVSYWRHYYCFRTKRSFHPKLNYKYGLLRKTKPELIHGHFNARFDGGTMRELYPSVDQFLCFLRDPLELEISAYNYELKRRPDQIASNIDDWLSNRKSSMLNNLKQNFGQDRDLVEDMENHFIAVGIVEEFQKSLEMLADMLDKPRIRAKKVNMSSRDHKPSKAVAEDFVRRHPEEFKVYQHFRDQLSNV